MQDEDLAAVLRALGHPVRLNILRILAERQQNQCCCTDVMQYLPLAQSTVSQHIKVLLDAGLIERHARGTRNCYSLKSERLEALGSACAGLFAGLGGERVATVTGVLAEPA
jgi:DNA-binding transcriptional ArsR family regulator